MPTQQYRVHTDTLTTQQETGDHFYVTAILDGRGCEVSGDLGVRAGDHFPDAGALRRHIARRIDADPAEIELRFSG